MHYNATLRTVASTEQLTNSTEVGDNSAPAPATHQQDFFAVLAARRQQASAGAGSDVTEELSKYLSDQSIFTALNCYPLIRKLYIELNIGLPASTAVERLFSLGESFLSSAI